MRRLFFALVVAIAMLAACKGQSATKEPPLVAPVVTDATTDLLFTWIDEKGEFHVETKPTDVPLTGRDTVRVRDPQREAGENGFVVDLRKAGPDGKYPVREMTRTAFEALAVARRKETGNVLAERGPSDRASTKPNEAAVEATDGGARPIVIYGAEWCGPCHQAAAYLTKKHIPFIQKDIEKDGSAAREMQIKLAKAGRSGGSIPVIDVRGTIVVGFSPQAVENALGTAL